MVSCSSIRLHPLRRSLHQGVHTLSGILHQKCELSGKIGVLEKHGTHSRDPQKPCCANQPSLSFPALHFALPPRQSFFFSTVVQLWTIHSFVAVFDSPPTREGTEEFEPKRWPIPLCPHPHSVQIRCHPLHSQLSPVAAPAHDAIPLGVMAPKSNQCHRKNI